jgi:hypothetical protein
MTSLAGGRSEIAGSRKGEILPGSADPGKFCANTGAAYNTITTEAILVSVGKFHFVLWINMFLII